MEPSILNRKYRHMKAMGIDSQSSKGSRRAIKPYARVRAFREMSRAQRIREIYALAHWRTTSRDEDEPYCLATLLLTDQGTLHRITETKDLQERREEFTMGQGLIGTREPPIGWALRRYLYRGEPEGIPANNPLAPVDKAGWHVLLAGITFSATNLPVKLVQGYQLPNFTFTDEDKAITLEVSSFSWLRDQKPPDYWTGILSTFGASKIGIIIEKWPLEYQERQAGFRSYSSTRGAVVAITEATTGKFNCFFCGTVLISRAAEPGQKSSPEILSALLPEFEASLLKDDPSLLRLVSELPSGRCSREGENVVNGQLFDDSQEWCIK
ncbi:HET domain protein [Talaromyces stipitatus ATCC 10500]|uniref:HET domain protein n=1 Tax=Talaromyces stipitatus (strain ATCC 10500 / CBS 375.48 / QM 6759 / NRRL 1006) TaxID=441959 RepID=B8M0F9_TALSN|nr:HET domain protein [Talaromyces stipitatus ATCC 10500]EED21256.1 HET domain protein [Talaromyces stipitatus ATCC 10500]